MVSQHLKEAGTVAVLQVEADLHCTLAVQLLQARVDVWAYAAGAAVQSEVAGMAAGHLHVVSWIHTLQAVLHTEATGTARVHLMCSLY